MDDAKVDKPLAERKRHEKISVLPGDKKRCKCCVDSNGYLLHMRAIQGHSGGNRVDPSLQDKVDIMTFFPCLQFFFQPGLIAGGKDTRTSRG